MSKKFLKKTGKVREICQSENVGTMYFVQDFACPIYLKIQLEM